MVDSIVYKRKFLENIETINKFSIYYGDKDIHVLHAIYSGYKIELHLYSTNEEYSQDVANYYRYVKKSKDINKIYQYYYNSINGKYKSSTCVYLGTFCIEKKNFKDAIILFNKAIEIDNNHSAHNNLANYYYHEEYCKLLGSITDNRYNMTNDIITIDTIMQNISQLNINDFNSNSQELLSNKDNMECQLQKYFNLAKTHYTISASTGNKYAMKNLGLLYSNNIERINKLYNENAIYMSIKWFIKAIYNNCPNVYKSLDYVVNNCVSNSDDIIDENFEDYYNICATVEDINEVRVVWDHYTGNYAKYKTFRLLTIIRIVNETDPQIICDLAINLLKYNHICPNNVFYNVFNKIINRTPQLQFIASIIEYKNANNKLQKFIQTNDNLIEYQLLYENMTNCMTKCVEYLANLTENDNEMISKILPNTFKSFDIYIIFCKDQKLMDNIVIKKFIDKYCINEKSFIGNRLKNCSQISQCPVCLEHDVKCIILDCFAHYVCLDCFKQVIDTNQCPCCKVYQRKYFTYRNNSDQYNNYQNSNNYDDYGDYDNNDEVIDGTGISDYY